MNIVVTERDKKLLRLVVCLAIIVIFGMYLIRPAMENHETLQNEYDAAEQKQQEYQTQIAALATIDDIIAQNEAALMLELRGVTMKCIPSPCFSSLSEGKKSYVPGWRLRDIIFVTKA